MKPGRERRNGVDRRENPGRREIDPALVEEQTWQEAIGHDRKVIRLLQEGYAKFTRATIIALVIICVFVVIALWRDLVLGDQNSNRVQDIQQSRYQSAFNNCEDSNFRNKNTITELNSIIANAAAKASPAQRDQIQASKASTILLINTLAPFHSNCSAVARQIISGRRVVSIPPATGNTTTTKKGRK